MWLVPNGLTFFRLSSFLPFSPLFFLLPPQKTFGIFFPLLLLDTNLSFFSSFPEPILFYRLDHRLHHSLSLSSLLAFFSSLLVIFYPIKQVETWMLARTLSSSSFFLSYFLSFLSTLITAFISFLPLQKSEILSFSLSLSSFPFILSRVLRRKEDTHQQFKVSFKIVLFSL